MSTVYFALLKAIENNYRKSNQPSIRSHSQSRKENYNETSPISVEEILKETEFGYSGTGYLSSFIDSYLKENPEVAEIVDKIKQASSQYLDEDIEKTEQSILDLIPKSEKAINKYTSSLKALEEAGFDIEETSRNGQNSYWYVLAGKKNNYEYHTVSSVVKINGIPLTKEMFLSGKNPYRESLNEFIKSNPNCEQELENGEKKIKKLSSNKLLLNMSKKRQNMLQELEKKVETLRKVVEQKQKLEQYTTFFDSLTEEQETKLAEFFDCKNAMLNLHNEVYQKRGESLAKNGYLIDRRELESYDSTFVDSALKILTAEESSTLQKFLDDVALKLVTASQDELESRTNENSNISRDMVAKYLYATVAEKTKQIQSELEDETDRDSELADY